MYRISTQDARTDLYGLNKGAAQVIDLSPLRDLQKQDFQVQQSEKAARAKKLEDARRKSTDLLNNQIGEVHPSDIPDFQNQSQEYRKNVLDAYKKGGGDISIEDEAKLNQQYNVMTQNALASKNRATQEKIHLNEIDNPNNPHRQREVLKAHEGFSTPSGGDYNVRTGTTPMFNIEKEVVEPLSKDRLAQVEKNKVLGKTDWTPAQAASDAENIVRNPLVARELHERVLDKADEGDFESYVTDMYSNPKDPFGIPNAAYIPDEAKRKEAIANTTPSNVNLKDVAKYEYANKFYAHGVDPQPQGRDTGPGSKAYESQPNTYIDPKTKTMETYTGTKGEEALITKTTYKGEPVMATPPQNIKFDDNGEPVSSVMTIKPSPSQMAENSAVRTQNRQNKKELSKQMADLGLTELPKKDTGILGVFGDSDADYKEKLKAYNKEVDDLKAQYPIEEEPYPEKSVPLSAEETKKHYFETWGVPIDKVLKDKEKTPGMKVHVEQGGKSGEDKLTEVHPKTAKEWADAPKGSFYIDANDKKHTK